MAANQAEPGRGGKPDEGRDLFQLISRAIDEAAEAATAQGMMASIWIDPSLRRTRDVDARHVTDTVRRLTAVALSGSSDRLISLKAEPRDDEVEISATAGGARTWTVTIKAPPARPRILVIDDDAAARVELATALEASGMSCRTACGSDAALHALFAGGPWAAVLIELYLESGDAIELAGVARGPVYAMSRSDRAVSGWALREAGFQGLFTKPVPIAKLRAAIAA